jgi:hypothetical protein
VTRALLKFTVLNTAEGKAVVIKNYIQGATKGTET